MEQQILQLIREGHHLDFICGHLKISRYEALAIIDKGELPSPPRKNSHTIDKEVLQDLLDNDIKLDAAMKSLAVTQKVLCRDFIRQGLNPPESYLDETTRKDLEIIALYRDHRDLTLADVGKHFGLSKQAVHQRLTVKYGFDLRQIKPSSHSRFRITRQELSDMFSNGLHTLAEGAELLGVSESTLRRHLHEHKIEIPPTIDPRDKEIIKLYQQGLGVYRISKLLNPPLHFNTIYKRLNQLGVTTRPRKRLNHQHIIDLHRQGLSNKSIAEALGCSTMSVYRVVVKLPAP